MNENNTSVNENGEVIETAAANEENNKTYTQDEVLALLQSEADKRVTQALKKQKKEFDKQLEKQKTFLSLDEDKRAEAEKDMRIAELEELVKQMDTERNKSELKSVLSARGLSAEFADIVTITDDIEASQANIEKLDKLFKAAVKAEVEKRIGGNAPKGNGATGNTVTKEEFIKWDIRKQQAFKEKNPQIYNNFYNN